MPKAHGAGDEAEPRRHCVASMAHDAVGSRARHWNVPQAEGLVPAPRYTRPRLVHLRGPIGEPASKRRAGYAALRSRWASPAASASSHESYRASFRPSLVLTTSWLRSTSTGAVPG